MTSGVTLRMMAAAAAILAAAALSPAVAQAPAPAFEPSAEAPEQWPDHPGRDESFYLCTACHGSAIIRRNGLSRDGWDDMVKLMIERHGMAELPAADRRAVVDYLAAAFPPQQRPAGGWRNPFAN